MKRSRAVLLGLGLLSLTAVVVTMLRRPERAASSAAPVHPEKKIAPDSAEGKPLDATEKEAAELRSRLPARKIPGPLTAEEKAARIAEIKRDYDEIRAKISAEYAAAGAAFPGGLNAFLRQLALLAREMRKDFAAMLTPRELEDLEMKETIAGQLVERQLGATGATEEQRRAVFRLRLAHEDAFALTFDLTPRALFEREASRQRSQEQIQGVLGEKFFGAWLASEGDDYARWQEFTAKHGLPPNIPLDLWRAKNELTLRRLELSAQKNLPSDQLKAAETALNQQIEARVRAIVGPSYLESARKDVLSWVPKR